MKTKTASVIFVALYAALAGYGVARAQIDGSVAIVTGFPKWASATADMTNAPPVVASGPVGHGDEIFKESYKYKHPIRLNGDMTMRSLFGHLVVLKKGAYGYEGPSLTDGKGVAQKVECLFAYKQGDIYTKQLCYLYGPDSERLHTVIGMAQIPFCRPAFGRMAVEFRPSTTFRTSTTKISYPT